MENIEILATVGIVILIVIAKMIYDKLSVKRRMRSYLKKIYGSVPEADYDLQRYEYIDFYLKHKTHPGDIVDQANSQAQQIVDEAVMDSDNIREGAIRYTDDMLKSLQSIINHAMEQTTSKFNAFLDSLQSTNEVVTSNRSELQVPQAEAAAAAQPQDSHGDDGVLNADMLE